MKYPRIDTDYIGKQEAHCPKCRTSFGEFIQATKRSPAKLKCGECRYTGPVSEFVSKEKFEELIKQGVKEDTK